jgi:hypothetical protein
MRRGWEGSKKEEAETGDRENTTFSFNFSTEQLV